MRRERKLRVFENRMLRRMFRPKEDDVTRERRRLNSEKLYGLNYTPNIIRVIKS